MRKQVEEQVKQLGELNIMEKVEVQTPCVSPLVVVPTPSGYVRLCVDMRRGNKAVNRYRNLIPNVEDTMKEATIFPRLDWTKSFHHMELEESYRYATTSAFYKGLYRDNRLIFGINASAYLHQIIIQ